MPTALHAISLPPSSGQPPQGLVILLHGWGANCQDLLALAPYLDLPDFQFVFPDAPFSHPYNPIGRMWYDFPQDYSFVGTADFANRADLSASRQQLSQFIQETADQFGIPPSQTLLGGFSQGGAMTLDVGLHLPLAGLMVMSGYLHAPLTAAPAPELPVLLVHGRQDMVVPVQAARQAKTQLQSLKVKLEYQEYDMGHEIQPMVLNQMRGFVGTLFANR